MGKKMEEVENIIMKELLNLKENLKTEEDGLEKNMIKIKILFMN